MKDRSSNKGRNRTPAIVVGIIGGIIVITIFIVGTIIMGGTAHRDTGKAVRSVSNLYLDELTGRRERVVASNLQREIEDLQVAVGLLTETDLSDTEHLQAFQARMKKLYRLEKFAFVDTDGIIYTSLGNQDNIADYGFDYKTISSPEISILNLESLDKKVIIAIPVDNIEFCGKQFLVCFMEIDMDVMLQGVSMSSGENDATFCNIYSDNGIALSNTVLGGLAVEDNLLDALGHAEFEEGSSYQKVLDDFREKRRGSVSFTYSGTEETLAYVPVEGTDWMLTYLIREKVITDQISSISSGIVVKSVIQSVLAALVLIAMFVFIIIQVRKNASLAIAKETSETENRVKQEEMEHRIKLQEKLLEEEKKRTQQDNMITAMSADYRSVYYVNLEKDEGICYRGDAEDKDQTKEGVPFPFSERFNWYAENFVAEEYREGFKSFIDPDNIRKGLDTEPILAYRYLARRAGREYYEMIRVAGVRHIDERGGDRVRAIGLGFTIIDAEMRQNMAQQIALKDALESAEQANKAKTAFLSNMSHEIRTPMNAIIGLDNIALNDPDTPEKTRDYLTKIGTSAEHLLALINDILDMSRIESGRMALKQEEFSLSKLLESINTMFSGQCLEKGLDYGCHIKGDIDDYYIGDNMKLRQVLINILGNAVKFTPSGGKIGLIIEKKAQFDGRTTLQFEISDTGIGMSKEFLPHIYDTFAQEDATYTNKYGSSGLGLAITKNIVEMMNGSIEVESVKGEGTTFLVSVTLKDSDKQEMSEHETKVVPDNMSVLIIDDDPVACEHGRLVFGKIGITADIALSGEEGLEKVTLRHGRREPYNLILIDWKMPGIDGVETTRRIRSLVGKESAIIILTAYKWDDILDEAVNAGVDSFIAKPIFAANILEEFENAFRRKNPGTENRVKDKDLSGRKILLAEDVEVNADIIRMLLQTRGIETDLAPNGKIAVDTFSASEPDHYFAILMDMRMPEMDGLTATRIIRGLDREDAKNIPIIALTANAFDEDVQRSLQSGLNAHLTKPIKPELLFETLESYL
ncbi:hybrid sensor histidine kinase/response regulator [Butyrivibrio sp. AE2032]|uniref:hybrid sensor histidine kinase/response regulator n=1 Tax=Butyrivibrio sp. AE2032 TaxID=1458463 RepID=UPI00068CA818|nr:hybrid sensor histidine kinase/response regulator [Butyrivibrio sp. AE2032]